MYQIKWAMGSSITGDLMFSLALSTNSLILTHCWLFVRTVLMDRPREMGSNLRREGATTDRTH